MTGELKMKYYGATYDTSKECFGEITAVFEVPSDWDGFRFHGYCIPSAEEIAKFRNEQVVQ